MATKLNGKPVPRNPQNPIVAALQPFVDNHSIAGAVTLVATKKKILDAATVGFANLTTRKPMQPDHVFWIASMTKPMTGTALMMLVDEGRVNVDDPVEKYLPEFKGQMVIAKQDERHIVLKHPTHPITVRNVLTHTSGLLPRTALEQPTLDTHPLRTAVLSYAMTPLGTSPDDPGSSPDDSGTSPDDPRSPPDGLGTSQRVPRMAWDISAGSGETQPTIPAIGDW